MDSSAASNPQHYQPLSVALHPPLPTARSRSPYNTYTPDTHQQHRNDQHDDRHDSHLDQDGRREEEEEEEEEEEVEGEVADHPAVPAAGAQAAQQQPTSTPIASDGLPQRRRPGRPKGSKNKKPRFDLAGTPPKPPFTTANAQFYGYPTPPPGAVPVPAPQPVILPPFQNDANSQQFYDFQWRVLTLCSEFYNAADELIRGAPPHVVAGCFSLPGNQIDPITILHEARRACDQLMSNPSAAVLKTGATTTLGYAPSTPVKTSAPATSPGVITNAGTFVMSLSGQPVQTPPYQAFQTTARYPTTSYYSYATTPAQTQAHPYMAQQQVMKPVSLASPAAAGNQGAWSDEETEKLRRLAEDSKSQGTTEPGEIDWDWVCNNWGPGRTRHQILIKATNVGMKESSTRGVKRRRENDNGTDSPAPPTGGTGHSDATQASAPPTSGSTSASPVTGHSGGQSTAPTSAGSAPPGSSGAGVPAPVTAANTGVAGSLLWSSNPTFSAGRGYYRERQGAVAAKQT